MELTEIIRRCQGGDREAMGLLYTSMHDELLTVLHRYVADENTAGDLLHDAFLLIFTKIGDLRSPARARAWMRKVVKNVALLYVEKQRQQPTVPIDDVRKRVESVAAVPVPITYDELMKAIDALPKGCGQVFRLSVLEGLDHQQIAALLDIEPHTSSSQLYRARRLLRQSLRTLLVALLVAVVPATVYFLRRQPADTYPLPTNVAITPSAKAVEELGAKAVEPTVGETGGVPSGTKRRTSITTIPETSETANAIEIPTEKANEDHPENGGAPTVVPPLETTTANAVVAPDEETKEAPSGAVWGASLAYSGLPGGDLSALPYGVDGMNPADSTGRHRPPLTIALDLRFWLTPRLWMDGGLHYTLLSTDYQVGNTSLYYSGKQCLRYAGLRLGTGYQLLQRRHWSLYATASAQLELPLRSTLHTDYFKDSRLLLSESLRLKPNPQWTVAAGAGLQYDLTRQIGFFAEPSLQYHFHTGDGLNSWRTDHRLGLSLPLGIRISF